MSAVKLNVEWNETDDRELSTSLTEIEKEAPARTQLPLTRKIAAKNNTLRCPHCDSIVYSRRSKLCGVCGRGLPSEYLFSPTEAARVENILRSERSRHRQWMNRASKQAVTVPYFE